MISDTSHIFIRPFKLLATSPDRQIIYGAVIITMLLIYGRQRVQT